jgi:hypothetical protein
MSLAARVAVFGACAVLAVRAQDFEWYTAELGARHVVLVWGFPSEPGNSIGRGARSFGAARVTVGDKQIRTSQPWLRIGELAPDREYEYKIELAGGHTGTGRFRTWPERADRLTFLAFGDWGNGSRSQRELASVIARTVKECERQGDPVRFILSTGDNIYSTIPGVLKTNSGDRDRHWVSKFFQPYREVIRSVPFYPVLGNHDGNEAESRGDLEVYLDNFFFPGGEPARYYSFRFAELAEFFALDTTANTLSGPPRRDVGPQSPQTLWLREALKRSPAPWKIPFFHHPPFNAGPRHHREPNERLLAHWLDLFQEAGVRVAFHGHEHNLQWSEANARSRGIRFVITGAGGELRTAGVNANMRAANIAAFAAQVHFLLVRIEGRRMTIQPVSTGPIRVTDPDGRAVALPLTVELGQLHGRASDFDPVHAGTGDAARARHPAGGH